MSEVPTRTRPTGTVLVTGMAGRLGRRLLRRLHRSRTVIGLGTQAPSHLPRDVQHQAVDPLRSSARKVFSDNAAEAVIHLGILHDPRGDRAQVHSHNLLTFQRIVEYADRYGIKKVVLLSSANTYGPRAENAQFLTESAPLLASGRFSEMHALVELDMYAQSCLWRFPELELVILRPANILGTVHNAPSNYLRLPVVPTLMGFDPMMQAVHQDDLIEAIDLALGPGIRGIFNIAGPAPVALSNALSVLGRRTVAVPHALARGGLAGMFRLGFSKFPAPELDFIRHVCMVDDSAARMTLGYQNAFGLQETLHAVDQERWVG